MNRKGSVGYGREVYPETVREGMGSPETNVFQFVSPGDLLGNWITPTVLC